MTFLILFTLLASRAHADGLTKLTACSKAAAIPRVKQLDTVAGMTDAIKAQVEGQIQLGVSNCNAVRNQSASPSANSSAMKDAYKQAQVDASLLKLAQLQKKVDGLEKGFSEGMTGLQYDECGTAGAKVKTDLDELVTQLKAKAKQAEQTCQINESQAT